MRRVAIIGSNQSRHQRRNADQNVEDIIYETVRGLLDQASLDIRDVDAVIGAGDDVLDGRSISNVFTAEYAGAFLKEESKVEDDGAYAASYAFMRIASGAVAVSVVHYQLPCSPQPPPYTLGLVRLDGADTDLIHLIEEGLSAGDPVRARFKDERSGTILDIERFVPLSNEADEREVTILQPLKEVRGQVSIPYRWSYGKALTRFFQESRDNKRLMGTRCPRCSSVTVPAARICTRCFVETTEWVEVSDHGVLETFTTVHLPFPGQPTEPPYTYGLILLDGASTYFSHLIREPAERLRCGMRVEAVWSGERKGDLFDILYFKQEEG